MLWNLTRNYNTGLSLRALYLVIQKIVHWTKTETVWLQVNIVLFSEPSKSSQSVKKIFSSKKKRNTQSVEIQIDLQQKNQRIRITTEICIKCSGIEEREHTLTWYKDEPVRICKEIWWGPPEIEVPNQTKLSRAESLTPV
jgi:hypothetical protein